MIQLIVQGEEIDLFKSEVFAISKSISKIGQFDLRFGDVSISFNIPLTSKNNRIFRYLSNLNHDNIGAFKRFEGEIRENNAILSTGYYQVLSTNNTKKQIKVRFFGGNSDWFDLIKDRFINQNYPKTNGNPNSTSYSLNYLNHNFEEDVIVGAKGKTDGYFYFPCDNGGNSNRVNNAFDENDFEVGVYDHTIFDNIFNSVGIKTKGSMFNDPLFYQTISTSGKDLSSFDKINLNKTFRPVEGDQIDKNNFKLINFPLNDTDPQWNGGTFTAAYDIDNLYIAFRLLGYHGILTDDNVDLKIEWTQNGIPQPDINTALGVSSSLLVGGVYNVTFLEYENNFPLIKQGDTIKVYIKENNAGIDPYYVTNSITSVNGTIRNAYFSYEITGAVAPFDINSALPKIKQSDFIKDIMFSLGVVSRYDAKKRVLSFDKFEDVERNKPNAKDYSDKIDVSKDIDIDFTKAVQNYFKTSFVRYEEDDNDVQLRLFKTVSKNGLGDGEISINNDNLSDEGDIFVSKYSATKDAFTFPLSGSDFNFYLPYVPFKNAQGEEQKLKPRKLIAVPNSDVETFSNAFSNITINGNPYSEIGYAYFAKQDVEKVQDSLGNKMLDDSLNSNRFTLSFDNYKESNQSYLGDTLLEKNYNLFRKMINNPITLPIYLNLNELDVQDYDPLTPVWLDFNLDSGYYYFEEIGQYKANGTTTKCVLVKI
jgi:hypothetical protein